MTTYGQDDLDGWEFKILRSATAGTFGRRDRLQAALAEEARAGWELVEKFDDLRIRLKRRVDCRAQDATLPFDAYRTHVGTSPNALALWIILGMVALIGIVAGLAAAFGG